MHPQFRSLTVLISSLLVIVTTPSRGTLVQNNLLKKPYSDVILTMSDNAKQVFTKISSTLFYSRTAKIASMVNTLQSFTKLSQAPVLTYLNTVNAKTESYWISNQILVKNATPAMIRALANLPRVEQIVEDGSFPILPVFNTTLGKAPDGPEWGVMKIRAHDLWSVTRGQNIIVATIDTGVRGTHSALKKNYVGAKNYGWFDPFLHLSEPYDLSGHGTHTTASIVGDNGVGVAPNAKWMACKGCDAFRCIQSSLLACGQFILCPHDANGLKKDCSKAPHIVSNSWGGGNGEEYYNPVIQAWKVAGIIPFFAMGNTGPKCLTNSAPGNQKDTIAVGSTNKENELSPFSSRGPNPWTNLDAIKPDILAPGQGISSAYFLTDSSYQILSGTSMACPHAAGAAALLLSVYPNLRLQDIMELLYETTDKNVIKKEGEHCGFINETKFPNHLFGHGLINVLKAYEKMIGNPKYLNLVSKPRVEVNRPIFTKSAPIGLLGFLG